MPRFLAHLALLLSAWIIPLSEGACSRIQVPNVTLGALSGGSTTITFDLTWSGSWRSTQPGAPAPNNWDAAWVFVKFRKNGGAWTHASLNNTGHSAGSGTPASLAVGYADTSSAFNIATNPGVGVFIYRSGDGTGAFSVTGASLSWNYAQDGVSDSDTVDVRVYGIEMVYVPEGTFFAGDNAASSAAFKQGTSDSDPWYIGSEDALTTTSGAGTGTGLAETAAEYYFTSGFGESATGAVFTIPANYPKGYQSFYMMKGELSQSQWVAFFNTLTTTQKSTRDATGAAGKNSDSLVFRNNVSWSGSGDATLPDQGGEATYAGVAMNYLSWGDLIAYLDWSGLRPMSELEFERSARGPYRSVSNECAWGNATITQATSISNSGLISERAQSGANAAVANHASVQGPLRVGSFASGVATRVAAGAGYFGAMDLSGNLWDRVVVVGDATHRNFDRRYHGNGALDSNGNANVTTWPSNCGIKGGSWKEISGFLRISSRSYAVATNSGRNSDIGGRGVRTAP